MKVNVNGVHDVNGRCGCGGIVWDEHGNWHGGSAKSIGCCNPLMEEL